MPQSLKLFVGLAPVVVLACLMGGKLGYTHRDPMPLAERFAEKVDRSAGLDACWPWTGSTDSSGYGTFRLGAREGRRTVGAHRLALELDIGVTVPPGAIVQHSCDNPPCCNPAHLSIGTHRTNAQDKVAKGRHRSGANGPKGLTQAQADEIRGLYASGSHSMRELGLRFGVSRQMVGLIIRGKAWV